MLSAGQATLRFLRSRARISLLEQISNHWRFLNSDLLKERALVDVFPELAGIPIPVSVDTSHAFELPHGERAVISGITRIVAPERIFEFGTFTGSTTALLADSAPPTVRVHTLDLPPERLVKVGIQPATIGSRFNGQPRYEDKIVRLQGDSRIFDFAPFRGKMDLVFVDGSHKYEDVLHDSQVAMEMLKPRGVVVWDDYQPYCLPVAKALDEFGQKVPLWRIAQTRLVVHRS